MNRPFAEFFDHLGSEPPEPLPTRRTEVQACRSRGAGPVRVRRAEAVAAVLARVPREPRTVWVGIDGKGASGKTTLTREIAATLAGSVTVHTDDFSRPDLRGWERDRFVAQVVAPLLARRPARYQRWDFARNREAGWGQVPVGVVVLVEGVSSTDIRLPVPWDLTVWLEVPREVRLRRAAERDGPELADRWLTDWLPSEDEYEQAQQPQQRVDLVVAD